MKDLKNLLRKKLKKLKVNKIFLIFFLILISQNSFCQEINRNYFINILNNQEQLRITDTSKFIVDLLNCFKNDINTIKKNKKNTISLSNDFDGASQVVVFDSDEYIQWSVLCFIETHFINVNLINKKLYLCIKNKKCKNEINIAPNSINLQNNYCIINGNVSNEIKYYEYLKKQKFNIKIIKKIYKKYLHWARSNKNLLKAIKKNDLPLIHTKYKWKCFDN